jgi:hypothetical protein
MPGRHIQLVDKTLRVLEVIGESEHGPVLNGQGL